MAFYGVYIPNEKKTALSEDDSLVFEDRDEAFKYLKKNRESRLKCFDTYEQAEHYSKCGSETTNQSDVTIPVFDSNGKSTTSDSNGNFSNCDKSTSKGAHAIGEKPSSFRAPTSQELVKFRKLIEQGDIESVRKTIWSNPRYLVSSGDTPTILKESFRYNGLHVAAIAKNGDMCSLILETVGDPKFISLYHGRDDHRTAEEVSTILLDLYLNTPEKGRGETALHLASKFGAVSVVETLTSYQECQMTRNIDGMYPKDIICTRNEAAGGEVIKTIRRLLEGRFYVPVMRCVDNSLPPVIGEPFAETQLPIVPNGEDLLSPQMEIRAIAGPMNKEQAETFRKRWKTPPRTLSSSANFLKSPPIEGSPLNGSPLSSYPSSLVRQRYTPNKITNGDTPRPTIDKTSRRLFDANMNDEKIETNVSNQMMSIPVDLSSAKKNLFKSYRDHSLDESLNESLIMNQAPDINEISVCESPYRVPGFQERNLKLADVDKGLEVIGRGLAKENNIVWREHWSFLNEFIDISSHDGLTKFEKYLQERFDQRMKPPKFKTPQFNQQTVIATPVSKICNRLGKLNFVKDQTPIHQDSQYQMRSSTPSSPVAFHAYLCVEKSCQIYAKRLLNPICENPNNIITINDVLLGELNRLKSLICSYKNDIRFYGIDFSGTHSRFAHIVVAFLKNSDEDQMIPVFQQTITQILRTKEKALQNAQKNGMFEQVRNTSQFICLLEQLLKYLIDANNLIFPEILTTENECSEIWQNEFKCDCEWASSTDAKHNRNIKRKLASNSQRMSGSFADFCARINGMNINSEDTEAMDEDDDEAFMSLNNSDDDSDDSDDDEYYTPPQSPLQDMLDDSDTKIAYDNYIYGSEPTKMDNDVFKALHDVEIDRMAFPNVYSWHNALTKYSLEERSRFPQPQHNSRTLTLSQVSPSKSAQMKTFSRTPIKDILPKVNQYLLKPSKLSLKD